MSERRFTRRQALRIGGLGALGAVVGTGAAATLRAGERARAGVPLAAPPPPVEMRLVATDGHVSLPGRDPLYVFGFVEAPVGDSVAQVTADFKGKAQVPAPTIGVDQGAEVFLTLTNVGLVVRPDLDDSHTVHWHGFRNPIAAFDGVPEVSVAVPVGRDFPYYFRPTDPGTYMYHCHFEDVEHVQMGMSGIVFVRPEMGPDHAYNRADTRFDREFALVLSDIDTRPHDGLEALQEFVWTDYRPNYFLINGRAYPDTILPNGDPSFPLQPISSLIQVNEGEKALLRFANLGYEGHTMQVLGIPLTVVGEDAVLLEGPTGADLSYTVGVLPIGPGEARDVLFTAPAYSASNEGGSDGAGNYNRYLLMDRTATSLTNGGAPGLGGMATEVRVYQGSPLPAQTVPNETYG